MRQNEHLAESVVTNLEKLPLLMVELFHTLFAKWGITRKSKLTQFTFQISREFN